MLDTPAERKSETKKKDVCVYVLVSQFAPFDGISSTIANGQWPLDDDDDVATYPVETANVQIETYQKYIPSYPK